MVHIKKYSITDVHTCALISEDVCNAQGCNEGYKVLLECLQYIGEDR
jgi:hypothetical protein